MDPFPWQHDDIFPFAAGQVFPQSIFPLGSDILVAGRFYGQYFSSSILKLSGADGSVAWASNIFYLASSADSTIGGIYPNDDGNIIVTGNGWAKLDAASGATLWSNPPGYACVALCYAYYAVVLSDGSLLVTGEDNHKVWIRLLPASAGAAAIDWHPDQDDQNVTRSFADFPFQDSAGALWMRVGRRYGSSNTIFYLAKFDRATGTFTTQQSLLVYGNEPLLQWVSPHMLAAPENNRFPAFTNINNPPEPFLIGSALVDSAISANGNLSMQITTSQTYVQPGQLLGFHLTAKYSGDALILGAKLVADFPWAGFATGLTCTTQSASNCQFDNRASTVVASFDVQPGGQVDITGNIRVTSTSGPPKLRALVAGPINLNELNSTDNAASAAVDQSMFANGFE